MQAGNSSIVVAGVAYLVVAALFVAWSLHQEQVRGERQLRERAELVLQSTRNGIVSLIRNLESSVALYVNANRERLLELARSPGIESPIYQSIEEELRAEYPDMIAFSIADREGRAVLEPFEGQIRTRCAADIRAFLADPNQPIRRLHSNPIKRHFDIMATWRADGYDGVFLVNFEPRLISNVLAAYQPADVRLLLVNGAQGQEIEFTARGERNSYDADWILDDTGRAALLAGIVIPRTRWELVAQATPETLATLEHRLTVKALQLGSVLLLLGILLLAALLRTRDRAARRHGNMQHSRERLDFLAHHDALTGLANRTLLAARLELTLQRKAREGGHAGVLFLDLDNFKEVNDNLGHAMGDALLVEVAHRLNQLRDMDTVARLGGDEFIIVLGDIDGTADAVRIAGRIVEHLRAIDTVDGKRIKVTASIGIAVYPDHGKTAGDLLHSADQAMYQAKKTGRDGYLVSSHAEQAAPAKD